jgi:rubrerythrin
MSDIDTLIGEITKLLDSEVRPSAIRLMAGEMTAGEMRTAQAVAKGLAAKIKHVLAPYQPAPEAPATEDQPGFTYYECKVCQFDAVYENGDTGSRCCPICEEDNARSNRMASRVARTTDRPEGFDARQSAGATVG